MSATSQISPRRKIWSTIAVLVPILFAVLLLVALTVTPSILGLKGPNVNKDAMFATGLFGMLGGLVALGIMPRRASTIYLERTGRYRRPSITGGTIGLSLLIAGAILILVSNLSLSL
jgi:membrane associated rhomboid family serine protease